MLVVFESDTQNKLYILPMLFYCFWDNMLYLSPLWKGVGARKGWQGASYVLTSHFWHKYIEKAEFLVWKQTKVIVQLTSAFFLLDSFENYPSPLSGPLQRLFVIQHSLQHPIGSWRNLSSHQLIVQSLRSSESQYRWFGKIIWKV